jgi:hypothetical protein
VQEKQPGWQQQQQQQQQEQEEEEDEAGEAAGEGFAGRTVGVGRRSGSNQDDGGRARRASGYGVGEGDEEN